jgi:hypothetical protein
VKSERTVASVVDNMWGGNGQMKNNILRHPSALESKGVLSGNKKWNPRPASWAAPNDVSIFPPQRGNQFASVSPTGREDDPSCHQLIFIGASRMSRTESRPGLGFCWTVKKGEPRRLRSISKRAKCFLIGCFSHLWSFFLIRNGSAGPVVLFAFLLGP